MEGKTRNTILIILACLITFFIGYYFLYLLPLYNNEQLSLTKEKQEAELKAEANKIETEKQQQAKAEEENFSNTAKEVQDDCIKGVQDGGFSFDKTNVAPSPMFYPYEDETSFNKNERLCTALIAYEDCLKQDPRNNSNNNAIQSMIDNAESAHAVINNFMFTYKKKTPGLCDSFLLSSSAKKFCSDLFEEQI